MSEVYPLIDRFQVICYIKVSPPNGGRLRFGGRLLWAGAPALNVYQTTLTLVKEASASEFIDIFG
jgi:hypothetical protein